MFHVSVIFQVSTTEQLWTLSLSMGLSRWSQQNWNRCVSAFLSRNGQWQQSKCLYQVLRRKCRYVRLFLMGLPVWWLIQNHFMYLPAAKKKYCLYVPVFKYCWDRKITRKSNYCHSMTCSPTKYFINQENISGNNKGCVYPIELCFQKQWLRDAF